MAAVAPSRPMSIVKPVHGRAGNGILPASSAAEKSRSNNAAGPSSRAPIPRLKVIIRRLAPGLTEHEFSTFLGEEWKVGASKVDWASYRPGKVSKDPSKPSRPSRAYLHFTSDQYLAQLSEKVRKTTFTDVKGSSSDSALLGPPTVEFAPYSRLPSNKRRRDARQGTIDQDQEFIDFLESLTNPLPKVPTVDAVTDKESKSGETKTVTPLIQYLRDKKANKYKEASVAAKNPKHTRQESKEIKITQAEAKTTSKSGKPTTTTAAASSEKKKLPPTKIERNARDAVKPTSQAPPTAPKTVTSSPTPKAVARKNTSQAPASPAPKPERRRERGSASAAAKILQRDLGIGQGSQGRRRRDIVPSVGTTTPASTQAGTSGEPVKAQSSNTATAASPSATTSAASSTAVSSSATAPTPPAQAPTAPAAVRNQAKVNAPSNVPLPPKQPTTSTLSLKSSPAPVVTVSPGATQAFLKHANPSQGVTEPLLEEAFAPFGTIQKVEIDKKKGFAYVDFADTDALQKAIVASPVKVAQGQVVVLERKTGASLHNRNARGGGSPLSHRGGGGSPIVRGGRGGGGRGRGGRAPPSQPKAVAGASTNPTPVAPASAGQSAVAPEATTSNTASAATAPP